MNFSEMKSEVFTRLNESSSSPVYWTEADVEEALNDGYEELSDATEWYERSATLRLLSGRVYVSLNDALPDESFLSPRRAFNNQTQRWLEPYDVRDLDSTYRQWETVAGEPQKMIMRGLWWLGTFPRQSSDSGTIKLYFTANAPALESDSDEPKFPEELHQGLVEYALYDLKAQEGESKVAMLHWAEFQKYQGGLRVYTQGRTSIDRIGVLGV